MTKPPLSVRQAQVAELVAQTMPAKEIAERIGIAEKTVRQHIYEAAARIPGNATPMRKLTLWVLNMEQP